MTDGYCSNAKPSNMPGVCDATLQEREAAAARANDDS
jgi:hypothetical protein